MGHWGSNQVIKGDSMLAESSPVVNGIPQLTSPSVVPVPPATVPVFPHIPLPTAVPPPSPLPEGLRAIERHPQFLLYQLVPSATPGGKPDKIPVNYLSCYKADPHDPANWANYATISAIAASRGVDNWKVGFDLTAGARIAVIDMDGCRDKVTGQLSDAAQVMIGIFEGCYVEVSVSGAGIHIWFSYSGEMREHECETEVDGVKREFYHDKRFLALGVPLVAEGFVQGCADKDMTPMLQIVISMYFPKKAPRPPVDLSDLGPLSADDRDRGRNAFRLACEGFEAIKGTGNSRGNALNRLAINAAGKILRGVFDEEYARAEMLKAATHFIADNSEDYASHQITRGLEFGLQGEPWEPAGLALELAGFGQAPLPEGVSMVPTPGVVRSDEEAERRRQQIAENILIGSGVSSEECPISPGVSLDEMLVNFCKIKKGKRVVDFRKPRSVFSFDEWKSSLKQSVTFKEVKGDPYHDQATGGMKKKAYETLEIWNAHPGRKEVETLTFRPGYGDVTIDPQFRSAANTWLPIERKETVGGAELFINHMEYLFGEDAPRFLDWLGHIEQHPGVLPTTGWVHTSPHHGTGRNWAASVLTRVWKGYTAPGFDLAETLRTGFNEELSQKLLVIVDEINEGGSNARWDNSEKLKSLITTETRNLNEKYGHKSLEWNCARWLIFSNEKSALPITERDRRFNVVINNKPPLAPEYYEQLFAALRDPGFIASVAWMLKTRDISAFRPGAAAVMSEAKKEMVAASKSEADEIIADLIENHPADVITNNSLGGLLNNQPFGGGQLNAHQRHALDRAGTQAYGKPLKVAGKLVKVRILRNHEFWKAAGHHQIQAELAKGNGAPAAVPPPPAVLGVPPPSPEWAKFVEGLK
jgi:Family of unknown function (DUF5906)